MYSLNTFTTTSLVLCSRQKASQERVSDRTDATLCFTATRTSDQRNEQEEMEWNSALQFASDPLAVCSGSLIA